MFAALTLPDGTLAHFRFGVEPDPPLDYEARLRAVIADYARRRDELWDVPIHLNWRILVRLLDEHRGDATLLAVVLRALGELVWDEPAPRVEPFVEHPVKPVRLEAIAALGRMGSMSSIKLIGPFLTNPDMDLRRAATVAAGKFIAPVLVFAAAHAAEDVPELREPVMDAAHRTHAQVEQDNQKFIRAVIDTDQWEDLHGWLGFVRRELFHALRSARFSDRARARCGAILLIRGTRKVGIECLEFLNDDALDIYTRVQLAIGMGRSTIPQAVPSLARLVAHDDPRMREAAIVALGRIGRPAGMFPVLSRWDEREGELRAMITTSLRRMCADEGAVALLRALEANAPVPPRHAAFIADDGTVAPQLPRAWLTPLLNSRRLETRLDAALLLGTYGGPEDLPALQSLLNYETDALVRRAVTLGVQRITAGGTTATFPPWPIAPVGVPAG